MEDIFVLSLSDTEVTLFTGHLERNGYRVTLFSDTSRLLATLRTGKPNLLICDATTLDREAFEVCRQIKEDDDLWAVPVLILTHASMLSDIFPVLDCKADNFIPLPFDLPFSLSVIETMLRTPVERQAPDQVKTQFGIRHDDQIYSVAASRRKLLELLLSSFEIAVNRSSELSIVKTDLQALSESAHYLEDRVAEQTRIIDTIKATLHQKEQKISILTGEVEEKKRLLAQKTRKAVIVTCDDNGHTAFHEKKDFGTSSCSESTTLVQQISELSREIDTAKSNLDTVQEELEEEKIHCTSLECTLELLVQQKEFVEKALRSLNDEHEQLLVTLEAERNRVISAEQELTTALQAKTQSEQELSRIIGEFNEIKNHPAADPNLLKSELDKEADRRISAENQLASFRREKEQSESLLQSSIVALKDQLDDLRVQQEAARTALEAERDRVISAEQELTTALQAKTQSEQELSRVINVFNETKNQQAADLNRLKSELDKEADRRISAENQMGSLLQEKEQSESLLELSIAARNDQLDDLRVQLKTMRTAFDAERNRVISAEQELTTALQAKTQSEQELTRIINAYNETKNQQEADLNRLKSELEREADRRISAENQMGSLLQEKEQSESLLQSSIVALNDQLDGLRVQLEAARTAFEDEKNITKLLKENLAEIAAENERTRLRENEALESDKATLLQQKHDLDEATATVKTLERDLNAVKIQNRTLVDELNLANQRKSQSDQQVRMLADDLKKVRTTLDTERGHHRAGEKSIETLKQIMQRTERDLRTSVEERNKLNQLLENERKVRVFSADTSKAAIEEQNHRERELLAAADEKPCVRNQAFSREETSETDQEKSQESIVKDAEIPEIAGSPSQAPAMLTTPDTKKSSVTAHELTSFKPTFQITEVSHEAVTDIIDIFSDDESVEEDNLS